jgi:lysophospholipase L1-like esterase
MPPSAVLARIAGTIAIGAGMTLIAACGGHSGPSPLPDAPTATCPANMTVANVVGGSQAVSYALPTVTGGTQPVGITCTPASGTMFNVGATTVSCTATDASARNAQCTFTVTLNAALILGATKFVAFGDSFTEGEDGRSLRLIPHAIDPVGTYPYLLEGLLNDAFTGQAIKVMNFGRSGEPIDSGRQRLTGVLRSVRPQALLLLHGYNDLLGSCKVSQGRDANSPQCSAAINEVVSSYRKMIQDAKAQGVGYTFASTLTPSGTYVPAPNIREDRRLASSAITTVNAKLVPVIQAEGATVVDSYAAFVGHESEYIGDDGLHPRRAGFQALADTFFAAIKATISTTPAFRGE